MSKVNTEDIIALITTRINELKYQRVRLKSFIASDRVKLNENEIILDELEMLLEQIRLLDEEYKVS